MTLASLSSFISGAFRVHLTRFTVTSSWLCLSVDLQAKMNTAVGFLPEININKSKQRRSTYYSRMKQTKESLRARLNPAGPAETLTRKEIALFRSSLKQSICVRLLQEGFHRSFSELVSLLQSDQDWRAMAEPGSLRILAPPLSEQKYKMETISQHLSLAEEAERTGIWSTVCEERLLLGRFFSDPEDLWLRFYFYHSCTDREKGRFSRAATEARACLTELYLDQGDLEEARQQGELCCKQAEDGGWLDSDGRSLKLRACRDLWKIYRELAEALLAAEDHKKALTLLHEGNRRAMESEDKQLKGEAAFQVGLANQRAGDHGTAKKFFNSSMEIFHSLDDTDGLVKAYKALAKSLKSEGYIEEVVACLEKLATMSRSSRLQHRLIDVSLCLGNIYFSRSQYVRAGEYCLQGYEVACTTEDVAQLQRAQVLVASAHAHATIGKYGANLTSTSPAPLQRLLDWKVKRGREDLSVEEYYSPAWFKCAIV
ncbi:tetratricopeptide repeat protein 29 isoform X1 [Oreochromis aureus]|uniref:Tetratricopeptide repeat protein 29 n=2 Tax=Oreochromis aureus TaxID=47969 RepID=A0A668RE00_OREAU|nr:tetratricopeptide repeat protein 29 isoform X1 [Oreochromis aureus]